MTAEPISLYFDIPEGEHVDLEVVARAAIEWVGLIREIATLVAPDVEFEIELIQTEEGSLWLSNAIKAVRSGDRKALAAVVWAVILFFGTGPALHLQADAGDKIMELMGHKDFDDLSDADKQDIADRVLKGIKKDEIETRRHNLIREVERDERVSAIGVAPTPRKSGPAYTIRRSEFHRYALPSPPVQVPTAADTQLRSSVRVKVLRASLKEGEPKPKWKFEDGDVEWTAEIEDDAFVEALNQKTTGMPLAVGQEMVVDLAIDRKFLDGEWKVSKRRIVRVILPKVFRRQIELDLGPQDLEGDKN